MASEKKLDKLTALLEKLLANPVAPVAPIAPIAPIAPVLPLITANPGDHDLLIQLGTKVDALKEDIKLLGDGTTSQLKDHETRIKSLEVITTRLMAYGTALIFAVSVVEFFIGKVLK